ARISGSPEWIAECHVEPRHCRQESQLSEKVIIRGSVNHIATGLRSFRLADRQKEAARGDTHYVNARGGRTGTTSFCPALRKRRAYVRLSPAGCPIVVSVRPISCRDGNSPRRGLRGGQRDGLQPHRKTTRDTKMGCCEGSRRQSA